MNIEHDQNMLNLHDFLSIKYTYTEIHFGLMQPI